MKNNKVLLIILIVFLVLAAGFFLYNNNLSKNSTPESVGIKQNVTKDSPSGGNEEILRDEPVVLENSAPLTQGNSLDDIQQDLNNTNIIEEDLGDLQ